MRASAPHRTSVDAALGHDHANRRHHGSAPRRAACARRHRVSRSAAARSARAPRPRPRFESNAIGRVAPAGVRSTRRPRSVNTVDELAPFAQAEGIGQLLVLDLAGLEVGDERLGTPLSGASPRSRSQAPTARFATRGALFRDRNPMGSPRFGGPRPTRRSSAWVRSVLSLPPALMQIADARPRF